MVVRFRWRQLREPRGVTDLSNRHLCGNIMHKINVIAHDTEISPDAGQDHATVKMSGHRGDPICSDRGLETIVHPIGRQYRIFCLP